MINKFEAIGIALSITAMAVALFLLRVDTTTTPTDSQRTETTNRSPIVVAEEVNQSAALFNALADSRDISGSIARLVIDDVVIGTGAEAKEGDTVTVNYIGTLQNGQQFDNSYLRPDPFRFTLGEGKVIAGWEQGILGMKTGGQRILVIPSEFAYGEDGFGPIPGGATLVFAIELISIE